MKTGRERLAERYREKYPDMDFSAEGALEDRIMEDLDGYDGRMKKYDENSKRLTDLFASDPRSAAFLNAWASGEDPVKFMLENFGDEFKAALDSPEGRDAFLESHNKWLEKRAKDKKLNEERDANFDRSMEILEEWRKKNNLTESQAVEVFMKIHKMASDVVDGIYTEEYFDMAKKAMNYDNDVAAAREDGEVSGRNAKIEERLKETAKEGVMPPALGGQGAGAPEQTRRKRSNMWGL